MKKSAVKKKSIAFQGEPGAYSEIAARYLNGKKTATIPIKYINDVAKYVARNKKTQGIIMLENSVAGTLHYAFDLLEKYRLSITGEVYLNVHHRLLAVKTNQRGRSRLKQIKRVYSHPEALEECDEFFKKHQWIEPVSAYDTAGMAKKIAIRKNTEEAAVASSLAAQKYRLDTVADNIQNKKENYVRFALVQKLTQTEKKKPSGNKVSLILTLTHEPGSLSRFLVQCAGRGMNLTKVESRPMLHKKHEYYFYVDFEHSFSSEVLTRTLTALKKETTFFLMLGAYQGSNVHNRINV